MMSRMPLLVAAVWWSSLSTIGFLVVPLLFLYLPTRALAGTMAARLFTAQAWVSVVCALLLLMLFRSKSSQEPMYVAQTAMIFVAGGMLLALLLEFAVAPHIVAREDLRFWHIVGTALYALQWLCAGAAIWALGRTGSSDQV